jgi:isoquinoline 1-oxidoreductase beta subunit
MKKTTSKANKAKVTRLTKITGSTNLSRRKFIVASAAVAGGGLALGFNLPFAIKSAEAQSTANTYPEINAWVVIKPDETCVIRIARTEMGQGTLTGLAQLVAEELECDWKHVTTEIPTPGQSLARKRVWGGWAPAAAAAYALPRTTSAVAALARA